MGTYLIPKVRPFVAIVATLAALLLPSAGSAQVLGTVAGSVKDASGAVLPGVTVEAASPALIEKVRSAVTDGSGQYPDRQPAAWHLHRSPSRCPASAPSSAKASWCR